jgi:hypothetical protein
MTLYEEANPSETGSAGETRERRELPGVGVIVALPDFLLGRRSWAELGRGRLLRLEHRTGNGCEALSSSSLESPFWLPSCPLLLSAEPSCLIAMRTEDELKDGGRERRRKALFVPTRCSWKVRLARNRSAADLEMTVTLLFPPVGSLDVSVPGLLTLSTLSAVSSRRSHFRRSCFCPRCGRGRTARGCPP